VSPSNGELPQQPAAAGTERGTNGEFALTGRAAREQQQRQVCRCDHRDERHGADKYPQQALHAADHLVLQGLYDERGLEPGVGLDRRPRPSSVTPATVAPGFSVATAGRSMPRVPPALSSCAIQNVVSGDGN
jgi:hypothetical protein